MATSPRKSARAILRHAPKLYGWGLAATGSLGVPRLIAPEEVHLVPMRLINKPLLLDFARYNAVTSVACGHGFSLFAVHNPRLKARQLFGSGLNTSGQLGFQRGAKGDKSNQWLWRPSPIDLPSKADVTHCAAGRSHSIVVLANSDIYACGLNSQGQCGRPIVVDEEYALATAGMTPIQIDLNGDNVRQVVCGLDHTALLSQNGRVWTFGCGTDGQLGRGSNDCSSSWQPSLVLDNFDNQTIVKISCAADSMLALTSNGQVYGWGNNEYQQISNDSAPSIHQPRRLRLLPDSSGDRIVDIAAGGSACAALTNKGDVLVWGYGIVGHGPRTLDTEGHVLRLPPPLFGQTLATYGSRDPTRVVAIEAGLMHFAAITNSGESYMWGKNRYSLLGLDNQGKDQYFPLKVNGMHGRVAQVALGTDHTLALTTQIT